MSAEFFDGASNLPDGVKLSHVWQTGLSKGLCPTGIDYVDDAFRGGLLRGDLLLLGAATGVGKTQLVTNIALNAARIKKRAFYFALEAERGEIEARIIFGESKGMPIGLGDYMSGVTNSEVELRALEAVDRLQALTGLTIFYKTRDFDAGELHRMVLSLQNMAELTIVDHFHFLDHDTRKNENVAHKDAIKQIKETSLSAKIPMILVAHLNKAFSKSGEAIPTHYDFYGTSDLANVATRCVTLSRNLPDGVEVMRGSRFSPTVVYVSKNRLDGSVTNYFAVTDFDTMTGRYAPGYRVFAYGSGEELTAGDPRFPAWATRATRVRPYT